MQDHYCWPPGFSVDERFNGDDPFITDKSFTTFNADQKTETFRDYIRGMYENYRGNHLMIPFGCDFSYANAWTGFKNMDRLIEYFNAYPGNENITLMYSTPGMYLEALNNQTNVSWPTEYYDMFPYADNPEDYWTGYFTSRPGAKKQVRDG